MQVAGKNGAHGSTTCNEVDSVPVKVETIGSLVFIAREKITVEPNLVFGYGEVKLPEVNCA
jgi:hypothetical protein